VKSGRRQVIRNRRFQVIGAGSLLLAAGFLALTYVVITSPGVSFDHPDGFTTGGRVMAVFGCAIVVVALTGMGVGGLRVALIIDETRLVIRNPFRTTRVEWQARPKFEIRGRRQDVRVLTAGAPRIDGGLTYRYHEIVCVAKGQRVWIAATSRMRSRARVDDLLAELRAGGGARSRTGPQPEARDQR